MRDRGLIYCERESFPLPYLALFRQGRFFMIRDWLTVLIICALLAGILLARGALAAESDYVAEYCDGQIEYVLVDGTRVDCLTDEYAIEYDYGRKWSESIGQALHYGMMTGRKPGIVLIYQNPDHIERLVNVIAYYDLPIRVWLIYDDKEMSK